MEFALKVLASFLVGGAYVALVTYTAEHINPRAGGVLAGLPSTALIGLIFIALTQNDAAAVKAALVLPAGFGFTVLVVAAYVALRAKYTIVQAMWWVIGLWLALAALVFSLLPKSLLLATIIFLVCFGIATLSLEKVHVKVTKRMPISGQELVLRALLAGILIAIAVCLAKWLGAFIGGIVATFPVIVITSLTMLDYKRGQNLMAATAKTMPFGSFGTVGFLVSFHFLVPHIGLVSGLLLSYGVSVVFALLALQARLKLVGRSSGSIAPA